jgi:hypothetical protein
MRKPVSAGASVSSNIERAAHALALDAAAAEVIRALNAAQIASLLLKGPAMAHWLYADDPSGRTYTDVDLLVSPSDFDAAEHLLRGMGFSQPLSGYRDRTERWVPESAWERPGAPPTSVDLHRGFHGVPVTSWDSFWTVMDEQTALIDVGGAQVRIPDAAGCALIAALHESAAARAEQSAVDLRRAFGVFDQEVWRRAAHRAERSGAMPSLVLALSLHEAGRVIVDELGLSRQLPPAESTRSLVISGADPGKVERAWSLQHQLAAAEGGRERARVLFDIAFPSAEYLRATRPMARRGRVGLALVRVGRLAGLALRTPGILRLVRVGRSRRAR